MYHVSFDIDFQKNTYPGKFIVFEGLDASGKSTQAKILQESLLNQGKQAILTHEPTRTGYIGELVHNVLQAKVPLPRVALQYLFCADRAVHLEETVIPALKKGKIVICERYFWSSISYGLADRDIIDFTNQKQILLAAFSVLSLYNQFLLPDKTFYFDVPTAVAVSRLAKMDKAKEIYEKKEQLEKIKKGYDVIVKEFSDAFTIINGELEESVVTKEIAAYVKNIIV